MTDWRSRIRDIVTRRDQPQEEAQPHIEAASRRITEFLERIVLPAFAELKVELEQHERAVTVEKREHQVTITVWKRNVEEFAFGIRGRIYHRLSAAFPQMNPEDRSLECRAEVLLYSGKQKELPIDHFTKETLIEDFLKEYEKWGPWGASQ